MSVKVTRRMTEKALLRVLGPTGRVWKTAEGWDIGFDLRPGRHVVGSGPTLLEAFGDAFLDKAAIKAEADRLEALRRGPSEAEIVAHMPITEASGPLPEDSVSP